LIYAKQNHLFETPPPASDQWQQRLNIYKYFSGSPGTLP
jgi:hypothetical protein